MNFPFFPPGHNLWRFAFRKALVSFHLVPGSGPILPFRFLFGVFASLCITASGATHGHGKAAASGLSEEDRQLFAWFDGLGIEDMSHAQLVRVRITKDTAGNKYEPDEPRGFLLWQRGPKCRVLLNDLTVVSVERKSMRSEKETAADWRTVSPDAEANALLRTLEIKTSASEYDDLHQVYMDRIDLPAQAFVLARFCAAHGREDLALRLLRTVSHLYEERQHLPIEEALHRQIGRALEWRATLALADRENDRHMLAAMFQNVVDHCPKAYFPEEDATKAEALRKMASEDDGHPKISNDEFAHLSPEEQARELVFQLRDEYTVEFDAWTRPWPAAPPQSNGAVAKLAALGRVAVPALLEALQDDRPSRDITRGMAARSRTIRELAADALDKIVGVDLWQLVPNAGSLGETDGWRALSAVAEDWWKVTQEKGEEAWLCGEVKSGGTGAAACLDALTKRYPDDATKLTLIAIPKTSDPRARAEMLMRLKSAEAPEVTEFLLTELANGPTLGNRIAAAYLLNQRHRSEGAMAMVNETAKLPDLLQFASLALATAAPGPDMFRLSEDPDSTAQLLMFLLYSDSADAIRALQGLLPRCEAHTRFTIMNECGFRLSALTNFKDQPASPATLQALEEMLVTELQDDTNLNGATYNKVRLTSMADFVAAQLNRHWPAKYHYSIHSPADVRARQLIALRSRIAATSTAPTEAADSEKPAGKTRKRKHS